MAAIGAGGVERLAVQRGEIAPAPDTARSHEAQYGIAGLPGEAWRQPDGENEPGDAPVGGVENGDGHFRNATQTFAVTGRPIRALRENALDPAHLREAQSAIQFGEAIVVTEQAMIQPSVRRPAALIAERANRLGELAIAGDEHSAFARGDRLVGIEAEDSKVAEAADGPAAVLRAKGLAGVLNHPGSVAGGKLQDGIEVGGTAEGVDDEDGARAGRDGTGDAGWVEVEREGIDVRENRRCALVKNGVGGGDEREGRENHLVAFTDSQGRQTEVQAGRARGQGHAVRHADEAGDGFLELLELGAEADPRGVQHRDDGFDIRSVDIRGREGNSHGARLISSSSPTGTEARTEAIRSAA